ncbi:hypothetical protein QA601_08970 [Chitinispirillales bacterium ANBcel5]|uniref:hypothetical protein n=1 Tax=Cellulosispirillum alkaliphilum TaxID=3039283 RepID=UPI002A4F1A7F|nr:hypothetical protein [Chitinispirillales bacterium ANBcel5]
MRADQCFNTLPLFEFTHLLNMSDRAGMFQHAKFSLPDYFHGYCTDDNARALILTIKLEQLGIVTPELKRIASNCLAFLYYGLNRDSKRFKNFMDFKREWLEEQGSEDCHGRALWALGYVVSTSAQKSLKNVASLLLKDATLSLLSLTSPRAWAFSLLGVYELLESTYRGDHEMEQIRDELVMRLMGCYERCADEKWCWFENVCTYSNAKLPHALILCGFQSGREEVVNAGLKTLKWLLEVQTAKEGFFTPVGCNGFYPRKSLRAQFDQQPVEAACMVSACSDAFRVTGERWWLLKAADVFQWFTGKNQLGVSLYDSSNGGCFDALTKEGLNYNQGAESTLSFLLSLAEMYHLRQEALTAASGATEDRLLTTGGG